MDIQFNGGYVKFLGVTINLDLVLSIRYYYKGRRVPNNCRPHVLMISFSDTNYLKFEFEEFEKYKAAREWLDSKCSRSMCEYKDGKDGQWYL